MLILYELSLSPFVQKVKIALREKGIPFERRDAFAGEHRQDFERLSARREVPILVDGDITIYDSTIILDYIDERWPDPPLVPSDPGERARHRMLEELCDTELEAINFCIGEVLSFPVGDEAAEQTVLETGRAEIKQLHAALAGILGDGEFFGGAAISRADISVLPHLNTARVMKNGPDSAALNAWLDRMNGRPCVAETVKEIKEGLADYKDLVAQIKRGEAKRHIRDHRLDWFIRSGGAPILNRRMKTGSVRFSMS